MAEIVGLTASILTFIEFAATIISAAQSVHAATDGMIPEVQDLLAKSDDIANWNQQMSALKAKRKLSTAELRIMATAEDCNKSIEDLKSFIPKVSIRSDAKLQFLEKPRIVLRLLTSQPDLRKLQTRLEQQDQNIRKSLSVLLKSDRHSELTGELKRIREEHEELGIKQATSFDAIQREISTMRSQVGNDFKMFRDQVTSLRIKIESLENEMKICKRQVKVLKSLHFREIRRRWEKIDMASTFTLSWLHNPSKTSFSHWLESDNNDIYCINGLPGSGKSTLMKHAFDNATTIKSLEKWAGSTTLCRASYFFWNQGFELQKSQVGLLQSLLYQIIKQECSLVSLVDVDRLNHEPWGLDELRLLFDNIQRETVGSTKFCFFIDGLDEYEGSEEGIGELIKSISQSPHIKVCASSRPRGFFDRNLWSKKYTLTMQELTMDDMRLYVEHEFREHVEFRSLETDTCTELIDQISHDAKGVWLWVRLVTRDLMRAVKGKETMRKLREIVNDFPKDLEEYFEHIINRVDKIYRKEMARSFLITIFEVQPLPLYAFHLLDEESANQDYALKADTSPLTVQEVARVGMEWKEKIHNRCSDLLVVDDGEHPVFLTQPVDFLHRTVRDFLRDQYHRQLEALLKEPFVPPISLCRIMLFFLKKQPRENLDTPQNYNRMIGLVDELLYYAREAEKHEIYRNMSGSPVVEILDQVDVINTALMERAIRTHWTHARDPPRTRGLDEYNEGHHYNWLALTIQARLVKYVKGLLEARGRLPFKNGRPLLDYALRPRRVMPTQVPYHSIRDEPNIDREMVELLLKYGADPNQTVFSHQGRTVWALFLISCWESVNHHEATSISRQEWFEVGRLLIEHGAKQNCFSPADLEHLGSLKNVLEAIFGPSQARRLLQQMDAKANETPNACLVQ